MNWKDAMHYGAAALAIMVGGATEMGLQLPGVVVSDPKMTITMGIGILVAGLKGGWTSK